MGSIKGIVFDKDGTLFSYGYVWGEILSQGYATALRRSGISTSPEVIDKAVSELEVVFGVDRYGNTYKKGILFRHDKLVAAVWKIILIALHYKINPIVMGRTLIKVSNEYYDNFEEMMKNKEFPDVRVVFEKCREAGMVIGIVTNDTKDRTDVFLDRMNIRDCISFLRTKDSHTAHKPNPEALIEFCDEFSLKPSEICFVGDTLIDAKFAKKGKVGRSIAVLTGSGDLEGLQKKADVVYDELIDILKDPVLFPTQA